MKTGLLHNTFLFLTILAVFSLAGCERDENVSGKDVEGHWVYVRTKIEVITTDSVVEKAVFDYLTGLQTLQKSYELKNDKTYYCYVDHDAPVKGIYKVIDKSSFMLDESRGIRSGFLKNDSMYIVKDIKSDVIRESNIDKNKILKVTLVDVFERGLIRQP